MSKIENFKYSIEEAFRECFYIVPDYQREYVWTEKEVHQLLDDINDEIDVSSSKEYFIGTILVSPTSVKNHFEVIDGQQRLTTFFLLLCILKYLFKTEPQETTISGLISTSYTDSSGDTNTNLKLEPRYENSGEIMNKLVELNSQTDKIRNAIKIAGITIYGSLENLITAYEIIYKYIKDNYKDKKELKRYWGYLATNVVFIQISADISSALKIFETINERGVGLNPMDLLKNLLFTQIQKDDFKELRDEWKKITSQLEKAKEKPLRFLRYFIMANYTVSNERKDNIVREDEIYDWLTNKENKKLCNYEKKEGAFKFVKKIQTNLTHYLNFIAGKDKDGADNEIMNRMSKLAGGGFSLHYVLLLSASALPKELFDYFLKQLEVFLFYYIFTQTSTKELERNFSKWADELRLISQTDDCEEQKVKLNLFIQTYFITNIDSKQQEFNDALKRYTLNTLQKYRTKYLLSKICQYVNSFINGYALNIDNYMHLEIEHILPNNPKEDLLEDFKKENPDKKYEDYKIKLGNLTLLEKPINIVAGRKYFTEKIKEYKKTNIYLTRSLAELTTVGVNSRVNEINKKLKSYTEWNATNIDERQEMLITLIKEIWKIEKI